MPNEQPRTIKPENTNTSILPQPRSTAPPKRTQILPPPSSSAKLPPFSPILRPAVRTTPIPLPKSTSILPPRTPQGSSSHELSPGRFISHNSEGGRMGGKIKSTLEEQIQAIDPSLTEKERKKEINRLKRNDASCRSKAKRRGSIASSRDAGSDFPKFIPVLPLLSFSVVKNSKTNPASPHPRFSPMATPKPKEKKTKKTSGMTNGQCQEKTSLPNNYKASPILPPPRATSTILPLISPRSGRQ